MKILLKYFTKTQLVTLLGLAFYCFYEFRFLAEWKQATAGPHIRVDLLLIYPLLLLGVIISLVQLIRWRRDIGLCAGLLIGSIATASVMFYQIINRYEIGVNVGQFYEGFTVIDFMKSHLSNQETPESYMLKYVEMFPVEINGVRTFKIID